MSVKHLVSHLVEEVVEVVVAYLPREETSLEVEELQHKVEVPLWVDVLVVLFALVAGNGRRRVL